jgi:hypothetical protein
MNEFDPLVAFVTRSPEPPALEVRVNFGVFAGRQATPAEIDDLARVLIPVVGEISIVAEERHEIGDNTEASLHQVRIEVAGPNLPRDEEHVEMLERRLVDEAVRWANACIAERHAEVTEV